MYKSKSFIHYISHTSSLSPPFGPLLRLRVPCEGVGIFRTPQPRMACVPSRGALFVFLALALHIRSCAVSDPGGPAWRRGGLSIAARETMGVRLRGADGVGGWGASGVGRGGGTVQWFGMRGGGAGPRKGDTGGGGASKEGRTADAGKAKEGTTGDARARAKAKERSKFKSVEGKYDEEEETRRRGVAKERLGVCTPISHRESSVLTTYWSESTSSSR